MQAPTPLTPKDARYIALRQGLLFGTFAGCLALLASACNTFLPLYGFFSLNFIYVLAFIAFFVAGWRAAKRTGRIDIGALAGFWAGVVVAILGFVTLFVVFVGEYRLREVRLAYILTYAVSALTPALLALVVGPAVGALGGFIGKTYAENTATPPAVPAQPSAPTAPVQPTQPMPPQQNQP